MSHDDELPPEDDELVSPPPVPAASLEPERVRGGTATLLGFTASESFETASPHQSTATPGRNGALRELPSSPEAEQHFLACCFVDASEVMAKAESAGIGVSWFFDDRHRLIYERVTAVWKRGETVAPAVIHEELKSAGKLKAAGGMAYLLAVSSAQPTTMQAGYFIEKVREMALRRETIREATALAERSYAVTNAPGEFDEVLRDAKDRITAIADNKPLRQKKDATLDARAYDNTKRLPQPTPIFTLKGTTICTAGNLTSLFAQAKAGKSALIGAMMAATFARPEMMADTLGLAGRNYNEHAVLHFDTEQSPYDRQQLIVTSLKRCGLSAPPPWLLSYSLTGLPAADCRDLIEHSLTRAKKTFGGLYCVIIDGTADLVVNPNDPEECFPLVTKLQGYAIEHETAIVNVVHMNPAGALGQSDKGRGHLGSQLERKSESNLTMEKDAEGITRIWGLKQRGKMIVKSEAQAFRWSDDKAMHLTCEAGSADDGSKRGRPKGHTFAQFISIFPTDPAKAEGRQTLQKRAQDIAAMPDTSFRVLLTEAVENGFLIRSQVGSFFKYHLAKAQTK